MGLAILKYSDRRDHRAFGKYKFTGGEAFDISNVRHLRNRRLRRKRELIDITRENLRKMADLQDKLYAESEDGVLIIFQAMDAAGRTAR
jgi:polyphosphate kinase 2 (PPK2 family)